MQALSFLSPIPICKISTNPFSINASLSVTLTLPRIHWLHPLHRGLPLPKVESKVWNKIVFDGYLIMTYKKKTNFAIKSRNKGWMFGKTTNQPTKQTANQTDSQSTCWVFDRILNWLWFIFTNNTIFFMRKWCQSSGIHTSIRLTRAILIYWEYLCVRVYTYIYIYIQFST